MRINPIGDEVWRKSSKIYVWAVRAVDRTQSFLADAFVPVVSTWSTFFDLLDCSLCTAGDVVVSADVGSQTKGLTPFVHHIVCSGHLLVALAGILSGVPEQVANQRSKLSSIAQAGIDSSYNVGRNRPTTFSQFFTQNIDTLIVQ